MTATALSFPSVLRGLDGQRIAGTSLAIALHAAVALALFMPVQQQAAPIEEVATPIFFERLKPITPPPPPPPVDRHQKPTITKVPMPVALPTAAPTVDEVDPSPDAIGPYVPPQPVVDPQPSGPSFVELATDVAPPPVYPSMALRRMQEGRVLLRVLVDEQGRPAAVSIEQSSGFRLLDDAALKVVQARWHFVPARRDGVAVAAYALVPVLFRIDR